MSAINLPSHSALQMKHPDEKMFDRDLKSWRTIFSVGMSVLVAALTLLACLPLFSVLTMLVWHGGARLVHSGTQVITELPPGYSDDSGGGFGNALVGTLVMVGLAAAVAIPFGVIGAIFLAEYGSAGEQSSRQRVVKLSIWPLSVLAGTIGYFVSVRVVGSSYAGGLVPALVGLLLAVLLLAMFAAKQDFSTTVRFSAKVLTGLPSILAGVFAYACVVLLTGFSALAGAAALTILMIPTIMLTAEEAIKMVPQKMKDAAIGMGCTRAQVIWKVTLPKAKSGILTGVMLAVARAAGETAPLIFTAMTSNFRWSVDLRPPYLFNFRVFGHSFNSIIGVHLVRPTASMAVFIFNSAGKPYPNVVELAWAASLVLVIVVLFFNVSGQLLSARSRPRS